jgi:isoaspartyl peptidase/L-asparaginase-like protein (Ntn-hydrolase superfamily)
LSESESDGLVLEHFLLSSPAIVIHGGAGSFERVRVPEDEARLVAGLEHELQSGWDVLERGGTALDAVVDAVAELEDSAIFNAGRSGSRTSDGELELDAAVMDGATGTAGAVCATRWPRNPVRAALAVSRLGGPTGGPVLLAGIGADQFAEDAGLPMMGPLASQKDLGAIESAAGTVGAVAVDAGGHVAAATSTGGRTGQLRGRVGDSPILGAGTWADDETVAVSATGEGEVFLVAGFAHLVDWAVREGATVPDALKRSMSEVSRRGGEGGAICVNSSGEVVCTYDTRAMARAWRDSASSGVAVLGSSSTEG